MEGQQLYELPQADQYSGTQASRCGRLGNHRLFETRLRHPVHGGWTESVRNYSGLGETAGRMMASVRPPVLNLVDAIGFLKAPLRDIRRTPPPGSISSWPARTRWPWIIGLPSISCTPSTKILTTIRIIPASANGSVDATQIINSLGGLLRPELGIHVGPGHPNGIRDANF